MRLVLVLCCLLPISLAAYSEPSAGSITGTVLDVAGSPIAGATVEVKTPQGRPAYSVVSARNGDYTFPQLPVGNYAISVKVPGMKPYAHAYLAVGKAAVIREDVVLEVDENPVSAVPDVPAPIVKPVRPPSKDFYAEDAEMELTAPSLMLDGNMVELPQAGGKGNIVWVYVPGRGRYLLSLSPHSDLGFRLAGQVGGASLWLHLADEEFEMETAERIAPGSALYNLYALRQPDWQPLAGSAPATALIGSGAK